MRLTEEDLKAVEALGDALSEADDGPLSSDTKDWLRDSTTACWALHCLDAARGRNTAGNQPRRKRMSKLMDLIQPVLDGEVAGTKGVSGRVLSVLPKGIGQPATVADLAAAADPILPSGVAHLVAGADQPQPAQTSHVIMPGFGGTWNAALAANKRRAERVAEAEANRPGVKLWNVHYGEAEPEPRRAKWYEDGTPEVWTGGK